ncbi:hypothetical protein, partial [Bacteroides acidifaciens]|uniref:hypothetical protein n=1 Tax=Bacteroides acidifaciens TaxID=85831 RepID=UPI0025A66518
ANDPDFNLRNETAFLIRVKREAEEQEEEEEEEQFEEEEEEQDDEQKLKQKQIEDNIKIAHDALNKALQLIKSENILLRPLPPKTNKQPQRYEDIRFNNENAELIEYLKKFGYKGVHSKHDSYFIINEPENFDEAVEACSHFIDQFPNDSEKVERLDEDSKEPIKIYYKNGVSSIEDINEYLTETVFKQEVKPFKIYFQLTGIFEIPPKNENERYTYEASEIKWKNYKSSIPIIVRESKDVDIHKSSLISADRENFFFGG